MIVRRAVDGSDWERASRRYAHAVSVTLTLVRVDIDRGVLLATNGRPV
jgi:hypothetical protein